MRIIALALVFHKMLSLVKCFGKSFRVGKFPRLHKTNLLSGSSEINAGLEEIVAVMGSHPLSESVRNLLIKRPNVALVTLPSTGENHNEYYWIAKRSHTQLDACHLDDFYISGKNQLNTSETVAKWINIIENRINFFESFSETSKPTPVFGQGRLRREIDCAISIVQKASFVSRSLQKVLVANVGAISKQDSSPVTIADFAVQALVIDALSRAFPEDKFVAEEDSALLKSSLSIQAKVLEAVSAATGEKWDPDRLFATVDKGQWDGGTSSGRVWVLDPIDGTKGFLRGQHYCIALALLQEGSPALSVLGCPNLQLTRVLQSESSDTIGAIESCHSIIDPFDISSEGREAKSVHLFPPKAGSVYFAASGLGAFARSLGGPLGGAFEVQVSASASAPEAVLCESAEASHGSRDVTGTVARLLGTKRDYVRLDGQCKYAIVGAGAAEGNLRLPCAGYREKIWDHAAGSHFVTEAGGRVTDLDGRGLNFSEGRQLDVGVEGIIASNGRVHKDLLAAVAAARVEGGQGEAPPRVFGRDK